MEKWPNYWWLW